MKISYAITVCNEFVEIQKLIPFLLKNKRHEDEIVVLYDSKNGSKSVETFLRAKSINGEFAWHGKEFNNHFADWKNYLKSLCGGDYVFQIDADEIPNKILIHHLPEVLELNPDTEVYRVPRVNTVSGLEKEHIDKWGWIVSDDRKVNWPDPQWRIYKNDPKIRWENKVHEVLEGYTTKADLPYLEEWALYHPKTIERQVKQNNYYNTL